MATYAIGDIQGCYDPLRRLLDRLRFNPGDDKLWVAGDIINRGPSSLRTVRFLRSLGDAAQCILGNHDLHLLAVVHGARKTHPNDTFDDILRSDERDEIIAWLSHLPLIHRDAKLDFTMVHAGLVPQWDCATAAARAAELEAILRSDDAATFFGHMYGDAPNVWHEDLAGWGRLRFITNALTRLRFCTPEGALDLHSSGPPGSQPGGYLPWYALPDRASRGERIVFGHWATLVLPPDKATALGAFHIDTGCVWGRELTALNLTDLSYTREPAS